MSAFKEFKKAYANGNATIFNAISPASYSDDIELINKRMSICLECPELIKITKQCKKCGCFMSVKTKLTNAACPLEKW